MPPLVIAQNNRTLVQTASAWPASDAGWTTLEGAWATESDEGFCNNVGSASFRYPFGNIQRQGSVATTAVSPPSLEGLYVRISRQQAAGPITSADGAEFVASWAGVVVSESVAPTNEGFMYTAQCQGGLAILDQIVPAIHYANPQGGGVNPAADVGGVAIGNAVGNKKTGNRSVDRFDFDNGYNAHVFDFTEDAVAWTALTYIEYILGLCNASAPGGPVFTISGQTSALSYSDKYDFSGKSGLEMLSTVMNVRQGVGFKANYDYASRTFIIDVMSLSEALITVAGGTDVPANDRQKTIDMVPAGSVSEWSINRSGIATYDEINVVIGAPQYAITFSLADFEPAWTNAEQTEADDYDPDDPGLDNGAMEKVGRKFALKASFTGTATSGFTIPTERIRATSGLHGVQGYTGALTIGGQLAATRSIKLLKALPMPEGYDWSTQDVATADLTAPDAKPVAFVRAASSSQYTSLAEYCGLKDIEVRVSEDGASFTLGPAAVAESVREIISSGAELFITLGVECQMNAIVSWIRPLAEGARDRRRVMSRTKDKLRQRFITPGTYLSMKNDALIQAPGTIVAIQDDVGLAKSILAIMVPWYGVSEWVITRTLEGDVGDTSFETGDFITQAAYTTTDGTPVVTATKGVVTSVKRSYVGSGSTTISTKRIAVDVEAFI